MTKPTTWNGFFREVFGEHYEDIKMKNENDFLREAFQEAKENINADDALMHAYYGDTRTRARYNGTVEDKYGKECVVGVSVPVDATVAEKAAIMASVQQAIDQSADFARLPREEKLEHYLRDAYKALRKILDLAHTNVGKVDWSNENEKAMALQISGIGSTADMACIMIPQEFGRNA
jgi:hypothetical protein